MPAQVKQLPETEGVGIDLGIKDFAIMSNGDVKENINKTNKVQKTRTKTKTSSTEIEQKL